MRIRLVLMFVGAFFFSAASAKADLIYNFSNPTGVLGTSQNYTSNGIVITAYGFSNGGGALHLFGKNDGGGEIGLGISQADHDEIQTTNFIQLKLTNVFSLPHVDALTIELGSVQSGESYNIYGSNTKGSLGTLLLHGQSDLASISI